MKNEFKTKMLLSQLRMKKMVNEFLNSERGDTNFVSIMLIIVIVIGIAGLFGDALTGVVGDVMEQLTDFTSK